MDAKRLLIAIAVLALAGCAAPAAGAPSGQLLPVEAQRVIDQATATAQTMATQNAQATATRQNRVETTADAWTATVAAQGLALERDRATQSAHGTLAAAAETAASRQTAAQATAAWATPTAQALARLTAEREAESERRAQEAAAWSEFWSTLRWIVTATISGAALVIIAALAARAWHSVESQKLRERAAIAREALALYPPDYYAAWDEERQTVVLHLLPAPLNGEPAQIFENAETRPDLAHAWRTAYRRFVWAGDRYGFTIRDLGPEGRQVVSDDGWRKLSADLIGMGVLQKRGATKWAEGWGLRRFRDELAALSLPHHAEPPPEVEIPGVVHHKPTRGALAPQPTEAATWAMDR